MKRIHAPSWPKDKALIIGEDFQQREQQLRFGEGQEVVVWEKEIKKVLSPDWTARPETPDNEG